MPRPKLKPWAIRGLAVLFWLALWQMAALSVGQEFLLASPLAVLRSLVGLLARPAAWLAALHSALRILLGFGSALAFALLLSALAHRYSPVRELVAPLVAAARAVPVASFVILALILVSSAWLSALIAFVIGFPVIYTAALAGLSARDKQLQEMAQVFHVPLRRRLLALTLPQLAPHLRAGAVTALGLCWKSGIAAELIGIPRGSIGEQLYTVKVGYRTAELFAWTIIIVLASLLFTALLRALMDAFFSRLEQL